MGLQAGEECSGEGWAQEVCEGAGGGQHGERGTLEELNKLQSEDKLGKMGLETVC